MITETLNFSVGMITAYIFGSIPFAFIAGRLLKNIDLRQHGSGNLGATNVFRVLGKGPGIVVLALDISKGILAILTAQKLFYSPDFLISHDGFLALAGIAAVAGHNWTVFLQFKGGKGVATTLGVLIGFSLLIENFFWVVTVSVIAWLCVFLVSGFVSLASVAVSVFLPVFAFLFNLSFEITGLLLVLGALSVYRHKVNIVRLLQKKESRFTPLKIFKRTTP